MNNNVGLSLYLSSSIEKNTEILLKGVKAGCSIVFTSMHIYEEQIDYKTEVLNLLKLCKENNLDVILDVDPKILQNLGLKKWDELIPLGIRYLRLDYGFNLELIEKLSQLFNIVINASTLNKEYLESMKKHNINLSKLIACHNYYPRVFSGLSIESVYKINKICKEFKLKTMSFVPSLDYPRGPFNEGVPTIENHRYSDFKYNLWETKILAESDFVIVGDIDCTQVNYENLKDYHEGVMSLKCFLITDYNYLYNKILNERIDNSEYLIRSLGTRNQTSPIYESDIFCPKVGDIVICNRKFARYNGEISIIKKTINPDNRLNLIGKIDQSDLKLLNLIKSGQAFKFVL